MLTSILRSTPLLQSVAMAMPGRPPAIVMLDALDGDFDRIAALHAECFAQGWSRDEIERLSRRPGTRIVLASAEGRGRERPLGFLITSQAADEAEIVSVGTGRKARRRGVGDALVRTAIRMAQADRARALFLEVDETNSAAVALYRGLGFRQVGERKAYYAHGEGDASRALVMSLPLR